MSWWGAAFRERDRVGKPGGVHDEGSGGFLRACDRFCHCQLLEPGLGCARGAVTAGVRACRSLIATTRSRRSLANVSSTRQGRTLTNEIANGNLRALRVGPGAADRWPVLDRR